MSSKCLFSSLSLPGHLTIQPIRPRYFSSGPIRAAWWWHGLSEGDTPPASDKRDKTTVPHGTWSPGTKEFFYVLCIFSWKCTKSAFKQVLIVRKGNSYTLAAPRLKSLKDRREELCLRFAKNCLRIEKLRWTEGPLNLPQVFFQILLSSFQILLPCKISQK